MWLEYTNCIDASRPTRATRHPAQLNSARLILLEQARCKIEMRDTRKGGGSEFGEFREPDIATPRQFQQIEFRRLDHSSRVDRPFCSSFIRFLSVMFPYTYKRGYKEIFSPGMKNIP